MVPLNFSNGIFCSLATTIKKPNNIAAVELIVIDIDILAYETKSIDLNYLKIPHPELIARKFVLVPWEEIAPDFMVQDFGRSVSELLDICPDNSNVKNYKLEKTA